MLLTDRGILGLSKHDRNSEVTIRRGSTEFIFPQIPRRNNDIEIWTCLELTVTYTWDHNCVGYTVS